MRLGVGWSMATALLIVLSCGSHTSDGDDDTSAGGGVSDPGTNIELDDSTRDEASPVDPGTDFEVCTGVSEEPENTLAPADIIFLVDNSPSMRDEILWTRQNLNLFSQTISDNGVDHRIVMISCLHDGCDGHRTTNGICIDPPLGSGDCETSDTNLPEYLHVRRTHAEPEAPGASCRHLHRVAGDATAVCAHSHRRHLG